MGTQILKVSYTDLKINVHSLFRKITDKTEDLGRDLKTKKQRNRIVSHTCEEQSRFLVSMPLGLCLSSSTWAALTTFIHWGLKQQRLISHHSEGSEVQDQGARKFITW
jgi:hypothetical protein